MKSEKKKKKRKRERRTLKHEQTNATNTNGEQDCRVCKRVRMNEYLAWLQGKEQAKLLVNILYLYTFKVVHTWMFWLLLWSARCIGVVIVFSLLFNCCCCCYFVRFSSFFIRLYTLFRQCSRFVYSSFFLFLRFSFIRSHPLTLVHPGSPLCCSTLSSLLLPIPHSAASHSTSYRCLLHGPLYSLYWINNQSDRYEISWGIRKIIGRLYTIQIGQSSFFFLLLLLLPSMLLLCVKWRKIFYQQKQKQNTNKESEKTATTTKKRESTKKIVKITRKKKINIEWIKMYIHLCECVFASLF